MPVVSGTAYWASVTQPNTTYEPRYSVNLVVDEKTAKDFEARGFNIKQMDEGPALVIKRDVNGPNGMIRPAPKLFDAAKREINCLVGNGSKVKVQYKEWHSNRKGVDYQGLDFMAMQVIDLVSYANQPGDEFEVETESADPFEDEL
jgi:hypothetical protein